MGSRRCFFSWIVVVVTLGRAEPWRSGNEVILMLPPVQFRLGGYRLLPLLDAKSKKKSNLRAGRSFPAQRQEVLCAFDRLRQTAQQLLQVFVAVNEIYVGSIYHQEVARRVVEEEVLVRLRDFLDVVVAHRFLAGGILLF